VSDHGYESFADADLSVIQWLNDQLLQRLNSTGGGQIGSEYYHLRGRGGINKATRLDKHLSQAAQLYEQGRLHSLARLELYLTHWLRYQKGIGVASSAALSTLRITLQSLCSEASDVMIHTFSKMLMKTFLNQQQNRKYENTHNKKSMVSASSKLRSVSNDIPQPSSFTCLI
jgi:hypothetical protein